MKLSKLLPLALVFIATSCVSVKVTSDYDQKTEFDEYKTFAFYKKGIDNVEISDLDKRRILRAIETQLESKGFVKSENPDILVNIFTKSREKINLYATNWGWGPCYTGGGSGVFDYRPWGNFDVDPISRHTEGTLFIDLIDADKKELAWQGKGIGDLVTSGGVVKKEERINEFVTEIMTTYPPTADK